MRWSAAGIVIVALATIGCASAHAQAPLGAQPVDASYRWRGYEYESAAMPGGHGSAQRLMLFIKATDQNGKLQVCGAYLAQLTERNFRQLPSWLQDIHSELRLGDAVRVRPSFLTGRQASPGDLLRRTTDGLSAGCVLTDVAWDDRFAEQPFDLRLASTQFKRNMLRQ
jgi:hypothetical protein